MNRTRRAGHKTTRRKRIIVGRLMLRLRSLVQQGVEAADDIMHAHGTPDRPLRPGGGVPGRRRRGRRDDDPGGGHGPHRPVPAPFGDRPGGSGWARGRLLLLRAWQETLRDPPDERALPQGRAGDRALHRPRRRAADWSGPLRVRDTYGLDAVLGGEGPAVLAVRPDRRDRLRPLGGSPGWIGLLAEQQRRTRHRPCEARRDLAPRRIRRVARPGPGLPQDDPAPVVLSR